MVISLYAKGLTTGDIASHLEDVYDQAVDRATISRITDAIVADMEAWQSRPLDSIYPVLLVDGIRIKIHDGSVTNRVVYVVMGINMDGQQDILGLWVGPTGGESPKFWLSVMTELKNRGSRGCSAVVLRRLEGPAGCGPGRLAARRRAAVRRASRSELVALRSKKRWGQITSQLREIYTAPSIGATEVSFEAFAEQWEPIYPAMVKAWRDAWDDFEPFLEFPVELRTIVYSTNAIESLNSRFRKAARQAG